MRDRVYTEQEVAALLERAAEMQAKAARQANQPGLTLAELEAVASESGLDPAMLRRAAAEFDKADRPMLQRNSGTTSAHVFAERRVHGTLSPELWEDVVAEMRHHFDSDLGRMMGMPSYGSGTTEQIGRTVEWKHTSMSGIETKLLIRPHGDWLDVRMSQRVGWASPPAEGTGYGALIAISAALISGAVTDSAMIGFMVLVPMLLIAIPLVMYADRKWREKKLRELESLSDRIATIVAAPEEATHKTSRPEETAQDRAAAGARAREHASSNTTESDRPALTALDDFLDEETEPAPDRTPAPRRQARDR